MNRMVPYLTIALMAGFAWGDDAVEPFHPAMVSLSNELEFDPLRGPVKSFEQVLYSNEDSRLMVAKGRFDPSGCLQAYEREDLVNNHVMTLVRESDSNTLVSTRDKRNTIVLNNDCQIVATTNSNQARKRYIYENGLLVKVKDARDAWVYKEYFYTPEGMPKSTVFYGEEHDVLLITESKQKLSDPWDFVTQGLDNGVPFYQALKKCQYDKEGNPSVCDFAVDSLVQGGSQQKERQQIRYTTTYY